MEPKYTVFVMPPKGVDAASFDIPEWGYDYAVATARRYRDRGWKACIIDYGEHFRAWLATGMSLPELTVLARTADEAIILARAVHEGYDGVQLEG